MRKNNIYFNVSLLVIFTLFTISFIHAGYKWVKQESNTMLNLRGVWFVDSLNGWACGDSGIVLHTSNGGENWETQISGTTYLLDDIFFFDSQHGWAAGEHGTIVHTTDGGQQWNLQTTNVTSMLHNVQFISPDTGFAGGEHSTNLSTTDGGSIWTSIVGSDPLTCLIVYWLDHASGTILYVDTMRTTQYVTVTGGRIWSGKPMGPSIILDLCGIKTPSGNSAIDYFWEVGKKGKACKVKLLEWNTSGLVGEIGETGDTTDLEAVTLEQNKVPWRVWAVGRNGWIISSVDSGLHWESIKSNTSADLYEISFPAENKGWLVGDSGTILAYKNVTGIREPIDVTTPSQFALYDSYPNPTNSGVIITYDIPFKSEIRLTLYDLLGHEVAVIENGMMEPGMHIKYFSDSNLPTGVYLLSFKTSVNSTMKKIIVMK